MNNTPQKTIIALKALNKIPEIREKYLSGVDFNDLSEKQALTLLSDCRKMEQKLSKADSGHKIRFMANYQNPGGEWSTVFLTDEELAAIENSHRKELLRIWKQCMKDANGNIDIARTFLKLRCHKPYTIIKQALDYKIYKIRSEKKAEMIVNNKSSST